MTYSYNPSNLSDHGIDRMRFELGDTFVAEPEKTAYLCDEEYLAVIESSASWKRAKLRLVETLLRRFSYEVDTNIKEAQWNLHQRVAEWKDLWRRLKDEVEAEELMDGGNLAIGKKGRPPIFYVGMHDWRQKHVR